MLIVISPAKTIDTTYVAKEDATFPELISKSRRIASVLRKQKPAHLSQIMGISAKLAQLNYERYKEWHSPYIYKDALSAVFAFRGEVYNGLNIDSFTLEQLNYSQNHLRILSGLYGILRPLDAILAYRLEMGTKIQIGNYKNLYAYWGDHITKSINKHMKETEQTILINLASNEYFKSIDTKKLKSRIITPIFKEEKEGEFKVIAIFAKKARGLMSRYILQNKIEDPQLLKNFEEEGYYYNDALSNADEFVFTR